MIAKSQEKKKPPSLTRLSDVVVPPDPERIRTGILGLDECLAETDGSPPGIPVGSSILLSGTPGGGKSTISLYMAAQAKETLILHGEERAESIRKRWDRLTLKGCDPQLSPLADATDAMWAVSQAKAQQVVLDSVQCLTLDGSRRHDRQYEAAEMICGIVCGSGGSVIMVCHMSKDGKHHAGAQGLAHLVDIHIHVGMNAKKSERFLEVRKNRHGRAGFMVPLVIGVSSLTCGTPAPLSAGTARTALEIAVEKAYTLLLEGKELSAYDCDAAGLSNPGIWRAGLEMAAKRLVRDGVKCEEFKKAGRKHFRVVPNQDEPVGTPVNGAETGDFGSMLELD